MDAEAAVAVLDRRHPDRRLRLQGRLPGGESSGAHLVLDGERLRVLKLVSSAGAVERHRLVERTALHELRRRGFPIPVRELLDLDADHGAMLHDFVPGRPARPMTLGLVHDLIRLNAEQRGIEAPPQPEHSWHDLITTSLLDGLVGYCEHESLRGSADAAPLLDRIRAAGVACAEVSLPDDDVVHFDFHQENILTADGRTVAAVVDWEGCCGGDRLFDLVMLAFCALRSETNEVLDRLWSAVLDGGVSVRHEAYVAHAALRLVDWLLRHHGPRTAAWAIAAADVAFGFVDAGRFTGVAGRT